MQRPPSASIATIGQQRAFAFWLLLCAVLVFAMILLGGATRLTGSGLSMVDWALLNDLLPPLNPAAWQARFEDYQAYPEFRLVNPTMTLAGFKQIFWLEYLHRLLGRLLALVFVIPMLWFAWQRVIDRRAFIGLLVIFAIGALQAAVGWYMVKSGLVDVPRVSHLRLAAHLGIAVLLFGGLLWMGIEQLPSFQHNDERVPGWLSASSLVVCGLIFFMILLGALVAGTHAGSLFNSFPKMGDAWIPAAAYATQPWWWDALNNPTTIQLNHRIMGSALLVLIPALALAAINVKVAHPFWKVSWKMLASMVLVQFGLGVVTLLNAVPIGLGIAHQAGAMLLFAAAIVCCKLSWPPLVLATMVPARMTGVAILWLVVIVAAAARGTAPIPVEQTTPLNAIKAKAQKQQVMPIERLVKHAV